MKPTFFPSLPDWRAWLEEHHDQHQELGVGFYKRSSGQPITWPEAVDGALCFGWIDGVRKSLDESSYVIRFTPRPPRSIWSAVNIKRVGELNPMGLMRPRGVQACKRRTRNRSGIYAYEQGKATSGACRKESFGRTKSPGNSSRLSPPAYRRTSRWWVISAKKEETRLKRLARLIEDSEHGRTIRQLTRPRRTK